MAESTLSPGDSTRPHVIRCAECHELVPADRVRHREERVRVAATPTPGEWRAGGPPIFKRTRHGSHVGPAKRPGAQPVPPPQRNAYAIERIPVCVDCQRRQRMGLYGVCAIAAICLLAAVALYSRIEPQSGGEQVALLTPTDGSRPASNSTETSTSTPTPPPAPVAPPTKEDEGGTSAPIWQPIKDAAASLFASASERPAPAPDAAPSAPVASASPAAPPAPATEDPATAAKPSASSPIWQPILDAATNLFASASENPTPAPAPASDAAPFSAIASATPPAPGAAPVPPAATTTPPTPPANAPPPADVAGSTSSAPPIWETERKPARKVAKASPPRREAPSANAVALRNDGYAALQQRRYREALTILQQATMMGDAYAPMYIGQLFERGVGVPRDVGQASYWYGIAINRGNGAALVAFNHMRVSPY